MNVPKILIVEDESIIALEIKEHLSSLQYDVIAMVNNGQKALEIVEHKRPDLVLMDIRLKGEMDGIETADIIRSKYYIPVVFLTAYFDEKRIERAKLTIPFGYILKPIQERELKITLEMALYVSKIDAERRNTEKALIESENKYRTLFAVESDALAIVEVQTGKVLEVNQKFIDLYGYSRQEALSMKNTEFSLEPAETKKATVEELTLVPVRWHKKKDGSVFPAEISVNHFEYQGKKAHIAAIRDITERITAEKALRDSEAQKNAILNGITAEIFFTNLDNEILWANRAYAEYVNKTPQELIGKKCYSFFSSQDTYCKECPAAKTKQTQSSESNLRFLKDGRVRDERSEPVFDESGNMIGIVEIAQDVTARYNAEKALQQSKEHLEKEVEQRTADYRLAKEEAERANQLKNHFLANISHELRTPMHHILNYSKYGVDKIDRSSKEKLLHYFSQIKTSGGRLLYLLDNLLDLSKIESGLVDYDMKETDLALLVRNLIDEVRETVNEKSILLDLIETHLSTIVVCDELKIGQVIRNLLSNAIKFTPTGRTIRVDFKLSSLPTVEGSAYAQTRPALTLGIKDQGTGIPESELESIFDKFIQSSRTKTNAGGTGLGLSICKEIIVGHKGEIWAENNLDQGATFYFSLPC